MKRWVFHSTILIIFSDRIYLTVGSVNLFAAYVIVVTNLCLLLYLGRIWLPRGLLVLIGCLAMSGMVGLMLSTVSFVGFTKDFIGIVPNAIYACAFLRFIDFDVETLFERYAHYAFYVAVIGLVFFPLQLPGRLTSIMREPSGFCVVCIPAAFYYADQWHRNGLYRLRFCLLLAASLLTSSSVGFMGLLMGLYLFGTRFRFGVVVGPLIVVLAGLGIYNVSDYFRVRMDDTVRGLTTVDLYDTNASSYGVLMGLFVTEKVMEHHALVGGGLGSYVISHDKYAEQMPGIEVFDVMDLGDLGRWDASSLLLRVLSEFGIVGFACCAWYLGRYFPWHSTPQRRAIALAILCYVFMKCVRSGTYFDPEEWLFLVSYGVNGMWARYQRRPALEVTASGDLSATAPV